MSKVIKFPIKDLPDLHIDALYFERWLLWAIHSLNDADAIRTIAQYGEMQFAKGMNAGIRSMMERMRPVSDALPEVSRCE